MQILQFKYGNGQKDIVLKKDHVFDLISPNIIDNSKNKILNLGINVNAELETFFDSSEILISQMLVGIAINDKTRPVPYQDLLPIVLDALSNCGIDDSQIIFFVANGTHVPDEDSLMSYIDEDIAKRYKFFQHNCTDNSNLVFLGETTRNTSVYINKRFFDCDLKISIGNIEPHHFAGYSGGYKTISIGLAGKQTINENHKLLMDPKSIAGVFYENPVRRDIDEIGKMTGLNYCLNCVLNENKEIVSIIFDKPDRVMEIGIPIVKSIYMVEVQRKYDIVITSAGGFPKDINFYQSQKALTNAAQICSRGGTILLLAECREGIGSEVFQEYIKTFSNPMDIITDFIDSPFQIGRHKAYLVARLLKDHHIGLHSSLADEDVKQLLIENISDPEIFLDKLVSHTSTIAYIPDGVVTIPNFKR